MTPEQRTCRHSSTHEGQCVRCDLNLSMVNVQIAVIVEEAGEVLQAVGKMGRFGMTATDTHVRGDGRSYDNLADLQLECGQLMGAIIYASERGLLDSDQLHRDAAERVLKLVGIHG